MGRLINFSGKNRQCHVHIGIEPGIFSKTVFRGFNNSAAFALA